MQISSIPSSQNNFGSNIPLLRVLYKAANGHEYALSRYQQRGPLQALITRLNNKPYSPEAIFFKNNIPHFMSYPEVSSSSMATPLRHLIFQHGDLLQLNSYRTDHYWKRIASHDELVDAIRGDIFGFNAKGVQDFFRRVRKFVTPGDKNGEPIGIVLHTSGGDKKPYKLGIDITDLSGRRVFAVLPSPDADIAKLQPKPNVVGYDTPVPLPVKQAKPVQMEFNF